MNKRDCNKYFAAIKKGDLIAVRGLLAAGADPNARDQYDLTPLIWSARKGQYEVFRALLEAGAEMNAVDTPKRNFLHHAVLSGRADFISKALSHPGVDINAKDDSDSTPLDLAIYARNEPIAYILRQAGSVIAGDHGNWDSFGTSLTGFPVIRI